MAKRGRGAAALGDRRHRLLRRRHAGDLLRWRCLRRCCDLCAQVRPCRLFCADDARLHHRGRGARHARCCAGSRACSSDSTVGLIGIDMQTGQARLALDLPQLLDGIEVVILAVGLFAVGETLFVVSRKSLLADEIIPIRGPDLDDEGRMAPILEAMAARLLHRLSLWRAAGGRSRDPDLPVLFGGAEALEASGGVRTGRDRGRCRAGGDQQFGRDGRPRAAADARTADFGDRGDHAGRVSTIRLKSGAAPVPEQSQSRLGSDRQPLYRQCDAAGLKPAARRHLGAAARHSATLPLCRHSRFRQPRRV